MSSRSGKQHHHERGSVVVLAAVVIIVLLGILALAIDLGYLYSGRTQLQNAVDAAALAGVSMRRTALDESETNNLTRQYAIEFAARNEVRHSDDPAQNAVTLAAGDIDLTHVNSLPQRLVINHTLNLPTFFAGTLGFSGVNTAARSEASLIPVDGGTGTISGGEVYDGSPQVVSGCWRPLLIPDTFFDASGKVHHLGEVVNGVRRELQAGDFYRSRFAGGTRNRHPYIDAWDPNNQLTPGTPTQDSITSVRDAGTADPQTNVLGQQIILTPDAIIRTIDFENSNCCQGRFYTQQTTAFPIESNTFWGYCGSVRVGQYVTTVGQDISSQLLRLRNASFAKATADSNKLLNYGYVISTCAGSSPCSFQLPNTFPNIIPVLMCNPFDAYRNPIANGEFEITNIGIFYVEAAAFVSSSPGKRGGLLLVGRFLREVMTGGTPLDSENAVANPALLPASVRLVNMPQ
jgi:hypothetical protein